MREWILGLDSVTSIDNGDQKSPEDFKLFNAYPNPFNPSTIISFALPEKSQVSLIIYDLAGRNVKTLFSGEKPRGLHRFRWNADDNRGVRVSSGVYFYRLRSDGFTATGKVAYIR